MIFFTFFVTTDFWMMTNSEFKIKKKMCLLCCAIESNVYGGKQLYDLKKKIISMVLQIEKNLFSREDFKKLRISMSEKVLLR